MSVSVQAFLLCQSVVNEQGTRLKIIQGLFDRLTAARLPTTRENCAFFIRFSVSDRPKCAVSIVKESPTQAKTQILAPISTNPDPNGLVELTCRIKQLALPEEGIYTFQLLVDSQVCSQYYLTVVRRRARAAPEPPAPSSDE
jgi:hypothetical protein